MNKVNPKRKMIYVVCRQWMRTIKHPARSSSVPVQEFFRVCSTMKKAQDKVDELTQDYGPTFIIVPAPLDPPSPLDP